MPEVTHEGKPIAKPGKAQTTTAGPPGPTGSAGSDAPAGPVLSYGWGRAGYCTILQVCCGPSLVLSERSRGRVDEACCCCCCCG